ncbi:MAG: hypothetical protein C4576_05910 [Desulfobacteraceae bacterium]|nr:MAG: hypothetical protein C4576_05910 [Desulfobacteraceae bacterium]
MESKRKLAVLIFLAALWAGFPLAASHGQSFGLKQAPSVQKQKSDMLNGGGRYVFGQLSDSSKDQFMVDTLTGRLWRISESGEVGLYLNPVPYRNKDGKYTNLPEETMEKKDGETGKR